MAGSLKINLSLLRDIGWAHWDPIGLLDPGERWSDEDNLPFADEYDSYWVYAADQLCRGTDGEVILAYLIRIEAEHMGLGHSPEAKIRARALVAALQSHKGKLAGLK